MARGRKKPVGSSELVDVVVRLKPPRKTRAGTKTPAKTKRPTKQPPEKRLEKYFAAPAGDTRRKAFAIAGFHPDEVPRAKRFSRLGAVVGTVERDRLAELEEHPLVERVDVLRAQPDAIIGEPPAVRSAVARAWGLERLNVPAVWDRGFDGAGVLVGHLDTGADGSHPALRGAIEAFAITDAIGNTFEPGGVAFDSAFHGTHTAAVIAGRPDGDRRVGVAPGAKLCSAIVMEGGDQVRRLFAGLQWLLSKGSRVVNLSLGIMGEVPAFRDVIRLLRQEGVLPVVAAGNLGPGTTFAPGNYEDSLAVGATTRQDRVWPGSSSFEYARPVDPIVPEVVAPGDLILSAQTLGGYWELSGTSQAAPHVSGLAALLFQAKPDATAEEVEAAIFASCRALPGEPSGRQGRGVPDALDALDRLLG